MLQSPSFANEEEDHNGMSIRIKLQQIIEKHTSKHKSLRFGPTFFAFMVLTLFFVVSPQLAAQLCQSAQSLHTQSIGPAQKKQLMAWLSWLSQQTTVSYTSYVKDSLTRNHKKPLRPETHNWHNIGPSRKQHCIDNFGKAQTLPGLQACVSVRSGH